MDKRIIIPVLILLLLAMPVFAEEVHELHYFGLASCPHCANLQPYLDQWEIDYEFCTTPEGALNPDMSGRLSNNADGR